MGRPDETTCVNSMTKKRLLRSIAIGLIVAIVLLSLPYGCQGHSHHDHDHHHHHHEEEPANFRWSRQANEMYEADGDHVRIDHADHARGHDHDRYYDPSTHQHKDVDPKYLRRHDIVYGHNHEHKHEHEHGHEHEHDHAHEHVHEHAHEHDHGHHHGCNHGHDHSHDHSHDHHHEHQHSSQQKAKPQRKLNKHFLFTCGLF